MEKRKKEEIKGLDKQERGKKHTFWKVLLLVSLILLLCVMGSLIAMSAAWGQFDEAKLSQYAQSTIVLDRNNEILYTLHGRENRVNVAISTLPDYVYNAFVAAEDTRFYSHSGVDFVRIGGALLQDIKSGSAAQGASTITQQLVKLTQLSSEKTIQRKLQEVWYAVQVELSYSKMQILEMYINYAYFGNGFYGVQAAAQGYFGVNAKDLDPAQAASLAATVKAPSRYAPHIDSEKNRQRREYVLSTMYEEEYLSLTEYNTALREELSVTEEKETYPYGWYMDAALTEAAEILQCSMDDLNTGGYRIITAVDTEMQTAMEAYCLHPENFPSNAADGTEAQVAAVLLDPNDGAILAMIGGREHTTRYAYNRAISMKRQPGSALKPLLVYTPALESGLFTPATMLEDVETSFGEYSPRNAGDQYNGWVTLRTAAAKSLNIPAVKILKEIGLDTAIQALQRFGIETTQEDRNLALALGAMTEGVSPTSLCAGYGALANGGYRLEGHCILRILDVSGNTVYEAKPEKEQATSNASAYLVTSLLQSAAESGTAWRVGQAGIPIAAKTGTNAYTETENRDIWCAAYTPDLAITVWMGFDHTDGEHCLSGTESGGGKPGIFCESVLSAFAKGEDFVMPAGVVCCVIDRSTLELSHEIRLANEVTPSDFRMEEIFLTGTQPTLETAWWYVPETPNDFTVVLNDRQLPEIRFTILDGGARYLLYRVHQEKAEQLFTFCGTEGLPVVYVDDHAKKGQTYGYYIVPELTEAAELGLDARGISTYQAVVTTPNTSGMEDFWAELFPEWRKARE